MKIRKTTAADIGKVVEIYDAARRYMRREGNMSQWSDVYPGESSLRADIEAGVSYVGVDVADEPVMTFALVMGADPTYAVIEDGEWPDDEPYGTIHRIATEGGTNGALRRAVEYALGLTERLRIDTHADNLTMLRGVERLGFRRCGTIHLSDGSARVAFALHRPDFRVQREKHEQ